MSILFLDIDGVLNSVQYAMRTKDVGMLWGMDPTCVMLLEEICLKTGCQLVISSTWRRIYTIREIAAFMIAKGMTIQPPIIGVTPINGTIRGHEVDSWLRNNSFQYETAPKYICVDDDSDFLPHQTLVQTNNKYGLTKENAERCIELLI